MTKTTSISSLSSFRGRVPKAALATSGLALLGLLLGCDGDAFESEQQALNVEPESMTEGEAASPSAVRVSIPTRVFSASPTLGAKSSSVSDRSSPNYGALKVFFDKAAAYSRYTVEFSIASWSTDAPKTIIQQVGTNDDPAANGVPRDSAYDSGAAMNPVWGFMYNSIPFGPDFELMRRFLYEGGGLELAQALVDARGLNVKVLPVVGSNPQGAGYFKQPIGDVDCGGDRACRRERPVGLAGLCTAGWTWRYYGQALEIISRACGQLRDAGIIDKVSITVGKTVLGQSTLTDVQLGNITAFEYASPLDDYDPPTAGSGNFPPIPTGSVPLTSQNPGHKGLRYLHSPGWHQGFYIGWLMLNKTTVWNQLSPRQQRALELASRDALEESYWFSWTRQCDALKRILHHNDGQVQLDAQGNPLLVDGHPVSADIKLADWPSQALHRLERITETYLDALQGGSEPTTDQQEFKQVLTAYRRFVKKTGYKWDAKAFDYAHLCHVK